jgi:uncharacterized DUF497 family protein
MNSIEWDWEKAQANQKKHGVAFAEAVSALEDEYALTIEDENPQERRFITLGIESSGRLLLVVYTYRGETIRIISARRATAREHKEYEAG